MVASDTINALCAPLNIFIAAVSDIGIDTAWAVFLIKMLLVGALCAYWRQYRENVADRRPANRRAVWPVAEGTLWQLGIGGIISTVILSSREAKHEMAW